MAKLKPVGHAKRPEETAQAVEIGKGILGRI